MILRVTVSNIMPTVLAKEIQKAGLSATVTATLGAGRWGIEPGATAEFAGQPADKVRDLILRVAAQHGEVSVYAVELDGTASLWFTDGRTPDERLDDDQGGQPESAAPRGF